MTFTDFMLICIAGAISIATIVLVGIKISIDRLAMVIKQSGIKKEAE